METAAIIGAGLIGRAWAMVFARAGWTVHLYDAIPGQVSAAQDYMARSLAEQQAVGLADDAVAAMARILPVATLENAVAGAAWVQENLPENVALKLAVFAALDRAAAAGTVLASSTSAIPASHFTEALGGRGRCLVAHPVNPPHLVPVVELCGATWTTRATIDRAYAVMSAIGQVPVVVKRELPGFILNRLQGALLTEAMRLVGEGYVSPADLDKTISAGLGLRWSFLGPFATIELNAPGGVPDYCARYAEFYRKLAQTPAGPEAWSAANAAQVADAMGTSYDAAQRDARMQWRDRRLMALAKHQREQPEHD
ncbi:MAG: 3-hydroxyacyl-CoA dehydrogenase [Betaproteobacteria bacterium]